MTNHRIYLRHNRVGAGHRLPMPLIKRCVREALEFEGMDMPCEVSVLVTDDKAIRAVNRQYRGIDKATDVLSFPMQEFSAPGVIKLDLNTLVQDLEFIQLGDIVLSAERTVSQAAEYGHPVEREAAYLTVHSVLHLLGYDHMDDDGRELMRFREEEVMRILGIRA